MSIASVERAVSADGAEGALVEATGLRAGLQQRRGRARPRPAGGAGEVVALLGPNGAGKTTTLLTISGELAPSVVTCGSSAAVPAIPSTSAPARVALVTQERAVLMELTVTENLRVGRCDVGRPRAVPRARAAPRPAGRPAVRRAAADAGAGAGLARASRLLLVDEALPRAGAAHRRPPAPGRAVRGRRGDRRAPRRAARPQGHGGRRPDRRTARGSSNWRAPSTSCATGSTTSRARTCDPKQEEPIGDHSTFRARHARRALHARSGVRQQERRRHVLRPGPRRAGAPVSRDHDRARGRRLPGRAAAVHVDHAGPHRWTDRRQQRLERASAPAQLASINRECALGRPIEVSICDDGFDVNGNLACRRQAAEDGSLAIVSSVGSFDDGAAASGLPGIFLWGTSAYEAHQ